MPPSFELRIRPGVERDDAARWRAIVHIFGPHPLEIREYCGEWLEGPDAEQRAEVKANELREQIREQVAKHPRVRVAH